MADCYHSSLDQAEQRPLHTPQLQAYFTLKLPVQAYEKTSELQTDVVSRKKPINLKLSVRLQEK